MIWLCAAPWELLSGDLQCRLLRLAFGCGVREKSCRGGRPSTIGALQMHGLSLDPSRFLLPLGSRPVAW